MGPMVSQITSLTVVYSIIYSDADQRKHQSSASLAFVRRIHQGPVNFPHKGPVTPKMFPFDDVIMMAQTTEILRNIWQYPYLLFNSRVDQVPADVICGHTILTWFEVTCCIARISRIRDNIWHIIADIDTYGKLQTDVIHNT